MPVRYRLSVYLRVADSSGLPIQIVPKLDVAQCRVSTRTHFLQRLSRVRLFCRQANLVNTQMNLWTVVTLSVSLFGTRSHGWGSRYYIGMMYLFVLGIYLCMANTSIQIPERDPPLDQCRARGIYTFSEGKAINTEQKSFFCSARFSETKRFLLSYIN